MGLIESGWKREDNGTLTVSIVVPFDTGAVAWLPDADLNTVSGLTGLTAVQDQAKVKVDLTAGSYSFNYKPTRSYVMQYSIDTPLRELIDTPETREVMAGYVPRLLEASSAGSLGMELPYSIGDVTRGADSFVARMIFGDADLNALDEKLKAVPVKVRHNR